MRNAKGSTLLTGPSLDPQRHRLCISHFALGILRLIITSTLIAQ
jgi:hypothetical protein